MPLQLTPEQERRIQAVVSAGAYRSTEEALNAALAVVETVAVPDFGGTPDELETLLLDGMNSGMPIEVDDAFWNRLTMETDRIAAEHRKRKPGSWSPEFLPRAESDIVRQFRYYLVDVGDAATAFRFREAVRESWARIERHPDIGSLCRGSIQGLRSWPVSGF